ncbi:acyltransferase [Trichococcus ilyis]|uniref:Lipopolysaccharide O-acetyltransferase n=1 Tax=Trichococcus ilyis TaxID=640938 RepID=A0A143YQ79_9LACT|nr:acyltransferase [Trichococcus ilyis]CZQ95756.1 Hypothetical protein TR210_1333 [Trichococcus ilyis]SEJ05989.1 lipopolysaccharide O-acetyltransferase [Trichococcus ilyis]
MKTIKRIIKNLLTLFRYPILSVILKRKGAKNLYIGLGITINDFSRISVGKNVYIGHDARCLIVKNYHGGVYNPFIKIGNNVSIGNRCSFLSAAPIVIKDNNLIASDVMITSENHGMDPEDSDSYATQPLVAKPVEIGEGCWIGEKVCILPGVVLGDRCIVAAGAVVTKSFPAYSIVGGVPAKLLKKYNKDTHEWE